MFLVTLFTLTSVHCAESSTDINRVKRFLLFNGITIFGYVLLRILKAIYAL